MVPARTYLHPLSIRAFDSLGRLLASRVARKLTLFFVRVLLLFRAIAPGRALERALLAWIKMESACCEKKSPHYEFLQRYVEHFERAGTFDRIRGFLRTTDRAIAARRFDAWARIGISTTTRHEILARHLGKHGVPPRLLTEAQLALSPGCDLTCEGCYTAEDRGGQAPRRDRIAYLVDEVVSCGAFAVHIIGKGEPFLSPRWSSELLDVIEERPHVFFTVATHAMHIDDALAARCGKLGNLLLLVAIDGTRELHDARRGKGSYDRVHAALARLRKHGAMFGFSCMVSKKTLHALTSPELLREREEAGCVVGIYSRYFPLAGDAIADLALDADDLAEYRARFEAVRSHARVPILDLDDVEQHTGCHSRAGESIYIDGITGQVAPCLRVPFAPPDCNIEGATPGRLSEVLSHAFFRAYRTREKSCPSWCGANLEGELAKVSTLMTEHAQKPARLDLYEGRARAAKRRLPLLEQGARPEGTSP